MAYNDPEYEERKKKLLQKLGGAAADAPGTSGAGTPSQDSSYEQRKKQLEQKLATRTISSTPVVTAPIVVKPPEQKQSGFLDGLISGVKKAGEAIKNAFTPQSVVSPIPNPNVTTPQTQIKTEDFKKKQDQYLKFPDFFPNPDFAQAPTSQPSAQPTKEGSKQLQEMFKNPIDTTVKAAQDFLVYHPASAELLTGVQQFIENGLPNDKFSGAITSGVLPPLAMFGITKDDPLHKSILAIVKGANLGVFGSSNEVRRTFEQRLYKAPKSFLDKGIDTVGQAIGGMLPYTVGTGATNALGIPLKAGLPLVFALLGQLSDGQETTVKQRLAQIPVDVTTGFLAAFIPGTQKGEQTLKQFAGKTFTRANLSGALFGGSTFISSLVKGMKPEDAAKAAGSAYLTGMMFYTASSALGYLGDELLGTKTKTGTATFTPDDLASKLKQTGLDTTPNGKEVMAIVDQARTDGKNVSVQLDAFREGILYKAMGVDAIKVGNKNVSGGLKMEATITDAPPKLPQEPAPKAGSNMPEIIKSEMNKPKEAAPLNIPGLDKITNTKIEALNKQDATNPVAEGMTRVYQASPEGKPTDWVFKTPEELANFMNNVSSEGEKFRYIDVPADQVVPVEGKEGVYKIPQELANEAAGVKKQESGSKLTLYHGSKTSFDKFDKTKFGSGEGSGKFGKGAYLTDNKDIAQFYAIEVAKKDFVDHYTPTGILGSDQPVYKPEAETMAKKNAVVNEFLADKLNLLDAATYKIEPEIRQVFVQDNLDRGMSQEQSEQIVDRQLNYAKNNSEKIHNYRGELDYMLGDHSDLSEQVAQILQKKGYDGIKYESDKSHEGSAGFNYVIYNTDKLIGNKPTEVAAPEPSKPVTDKFYINKAGEGFVEVKAKPVNVGAGLDTFIHKSPDGKSWVVSEGHTGKLIGTGSTMQMATDDAIGLVQRNSAKLSDIINTSIEKNGESPRYDIIKAHADTASKESAISTQNGLPATDNAGGDNSAGASDRSGQHADIVPNGKNQQGGTGAATTEPSQQLPQRGRQSGDDSSGERSGARLIEGDKVYFTENGEKITGVIRSTGNTKASIAVDKVDVAGGVPIRRIATIPLDKVFLDQQPEHIIKGKELSKTLTEDQVQTKLTNYLQAYIDRNSTVEKFISDVNNQGATFGEFEGYVDIKSGIATVKLADDRVFKFGLKKLYSDNHVAPILKPTNQVEINQQIEQLVLDKGSDPNAYTTDEKALLAQYSGAGGLEKSGAEGRGLLDEYYTPKPIVDFVWKKVLSRMNKIDSMLEPASGIGTFLEQAKDIKSIDAREINQTAATISKVLYPNANVIVAPFESKFMDDRGNKLTITDENKYDLVIGNPPYGEHRGRYLGLGEEPKIVKYEDYFVKRGLDLLHNGGMLAYVVPSGFLRSGNDYAKQEIAKLGTLIDAYRLPNGSFGNTSIGTDIIFIKRGAGGSAAVDSLSNDNFFTEFPEKILGMVSKGTGNYGSDEVKGSLENAIQIADTQPIKVSDTIPIEDVQSSEVEQVKETEQNIAETKKETMPAPRRAAEPKVVADDINRRAQIVPNKKDTTIALSSFSAEELNMWRAVTVTGELDDVYTAAYDPKTFVSENTTVDLTSGTPKYYPDFLYFQGNIYEKLDQLEVFKDSIHPRQYEKQRKGLEAIIPPVQSLADTVLQPVSDFVHSITFQTPTGDVSLLDMFREYMHELPYEAFGGSSSWEIDGYVAGSIVNTGDKLQNIEVRKRRRQMGNSLFKRFIEESLTPEQKKVIEDRYNRSLNAYYRADYKKIPLLGLVNSTFNPKGKSGKHPLVIKDIQKEGAAFLALKGTGLLGYDVGVGKTLTAIVAINEVMQRGWAKRPLIVVPNGVYRNWITEISEIMPNIKINSLMNLGAAFKGDLKTLQIEPGTLSIITYDGLVKMGFKPETYDELTGDLKDVMLGMNNTKRSAAKEGAKVEEQIGRAIRGTTGDRFFEDLGFDHVTIDEVHNFKNIFAGAKLASGKGNEFRNVRGSSSARGIKGYLMSQYVLKKNNNRNVFLLSATPFTNSPMEIYSILSLMGKKRLEDIGLKNVNDFMSMFMELKPTFVVKANQEVKEEDVIEKFQNLQQLQKLVTEFIDFRTGEEAGVDRPGRNKRTIPIPANTLQMDYIEKAQALFSAANKNKGGAIVGITELQNITLSPYLSRYNDHQPTYLEFVENSPKLKYAIEAIAQVYKDNPKVGQIIYMPRGVEQFPLIREYLIREKKFKPSQIAEITGGMSIDAKQSIQQDFNEGIVKVLLGTEAIKEGVNLQEKSTDLYHLHLPWNPTDMLQVEGRIWRQGNEWSNVRIHYPLIENSVDSFIFQKLETKEKRIKNLWSYKSNEVSIGDLNFEEMKLDLITNPVIKVNAEKTFETKKENTKLETLKIEKAFTERKIKSLVTAEENMTEAQRSFDETIADSNMGDGAKAYYQKKLDKAKEELATVRSQLTREGVDVPILEKKSQEINDKIKLQEEKIAGMDAVFEEKKKVAEQQKVDMVAKPMDYYSLMKDISEENKTFFTKRKNIPISEVMDYKSGGGGNASIGDFSDVQSAEKAVENIKVVEFPELLRIAQELMGTTPKLKRFPRALGMFYGKGQGEIKLSPEIFKKPGLAAKVFAHEIGHLADFLPDGTLARGNLIGRLNSLNKFLRGTYGENEITNAQVRSELKELTMAWKPFDELVSPGYTNYRYSSKELYADAISVLFNDPALLKEKAPTFWSGFFEGLDTKPDVMESFQKTWDILNQGEEEVFKKRDEALNDAFKKAEDLFYAKEVDMRKARSSLLFQVQVLFDDKNQAVINKVKEAQRNGVNIEDGKNPMYDMAGFNYLDGKLKNYINETFQPVFALAQSVGDGWNSLGKILQLERAVYERGDLANPGGYDKKTAQDQLIGMQKHMDSKEWEILQQAKEKFRAAVQKFNDAAEKSGYYTPEIIKEIKANPAYATFQVVDYLDTYISAAVKHQVGTLKDVANPATSTVMKMISLAKAIERNKVKVDTMDLLLTSFSGEIQPARTAFTSEKRPAEILEPKDKDQGLVVVIRDGKAVGYYVDKHIANTLGYVSNETVRMAAKVMRIISGSPFYRPLFTGINLGFQSFNFVRDFMRYWKNVPDYTMTEAITSFPRAVGRYVQAVPHAYNRALGKPDEIIKAMENSQMLGLNFNDIFHDPVDPTDRQIERVLQKVGILEKETKRGILTPIYKVLEGVELLGNFIESLPKVAGYIELKDKMPEQQLADFIRTKVGSPDFLTSGTFTPISNNIFLFSNAIKEGIKSDLMVATGKSGGGKYSQSGFWWKNVLSSILPKFIMAGLALGLGGAWLKDRMDDVSEYDKANYTIIPLGVDENGKTVYLRAPQDETGRLLGGLMWKTLNTVQSQKIGVEDIMQLFAFGAGQFPNLSPNFTGIGAMMEYMGGQNPYDSYRGRNVIPDREFQAGFKYSAPIFFSWLLQNQGLGVIIPSYVPDNPSKLQKVLNFPVISNILGRWIKASDYGRTEQLNVVGSEIKEQKARASIEQDNVIKKAANTYASGAQSMTRKWELQRAAINEVWNSLPVQDRTAQKAAAIRKDIVTTFLKGEADANMKSLISSTSNAEKARKLKAIQSTMTTEEFQQLQQDAVKYKVLSPEALNLFRKLK